MEKKEKEKVIYKCPKCDEQVDITDLIKERLLRLVHELTDRFR